jgi:hypothetical protein
MYAFVLSKRKGSAELLLEHRHKHPWPGVEMLLLARALVNAIPGRGTDCPTVNLPYLGLMEGADPASGGNI